MIAIKINGEFVETNENLSVTLQQGVEEPSNITSRSFKHSYTISIENNSNHRKIFNMFDPKKTGNFNQTVNNSVEIYSNGTQIFQGVAKITEVDVEEIKFFCISEEASWVQDIQGNLQDLNFGTGYTFYGARNSGGSYPSDAVFVKDFWTGNTAQGITTNEIIQFPLISYGNFYIGQWNITSYSLTAGAIFTADRNLDHIRNGTNFRLNLRAGINSNIDSDIFQIDRINSTQFRLVSSNTVLLLTSGILTTIANPGTMEFQESNEYFDLGQSPLNSEQKYSAIHELEMEDIPPAFNIKKTFYNIFNNSGWRITSSFMSSEKFENLYMTYSGKKDPGWNWWTLSYVELDNGFKELNKNTTYYEFAEQGGSAGTNGHIIGYIDSAETTDYMNNYSPVDGYVVPKNGTYNIKCQISGDTYFEYRALTDPTMPNLIYLAKRSNKFGINSFEQANGTTGIIDALTAITNSTANIIQNDEILFYVDTNWYNSGFANPTFPYTVPTNSLDIFGSSSDATVATRSLRTLSAQSVTVTFHQYEYIFSVELNMPLTKGERLKFSNSFGGYNIDMTDSESQIDVFHSEIRLIENEDGTTPDEFLLPEKSMPEMTQVDFVKSIVNTFNLYSYTDYQNKDILFEPRNEFILPSQFSLDWRDKEYLIVNYSPLELSKKYTFQWAKDTNDIWTRPTEILYGEQQWTKYGDGTYYQSIDQITAQGESILSTQKIGFCAEREYHSNLIVGQDSTSYYLFIPTMMRKDDEFVPQRNVSWSFDHQPKIVEWYGMRKGAFIFDEELQTKYPYAKSTYATGFTLSWYDKNIFNGIVITSTPGMYSTFYKDQINEYINSEMTEITFIISTKDYLELDTRKQIFWNECHYRVIDIQYQPSQKLAKLKMIKTNI